VEAVEVSVAPAGVAIITTVATITAVGGRASGIARMLLKPLLTQPEHLALEIVGRKLQEILSCAARRLTLPLVVLESPLVTNL
jgi:hypothetical protein